MELTSSFINATKSSRRTPPVHSHFSQCCIIWHLSPHIMDFHLMSDLFLGYFSTVQEGHTNIKSMLKNIFWISLWDQTIPGFMRKSKVQVGREYEGTRSPCFKCLFLVAKLYVNKDAGQNCKEEHQVPHLG